MGLGVWAIKSRERFKNEDLITATTISMRAFLDGILGRLYTGKIVESQLAGEHIQLEITNPIDYRRQRNLYGEEPVIQWLLTGVDDETVVWDVGAFEGIQTILAAMSGANVIAFEPVDAHRERIRTNARRNDVTDQITIAPIALADTYGEVGMSASSSTATIVPNGSGTCTSPAADVIQSDDGNTYPRPDRVKIDVEGYEIDVLAGFGEQLASIDRLVVECHNTTDRVISMLADAGLAVHRWTTPVRSETWVLAGESVPAVANGDTL